MLNIKKLIIKLLSETKTIQSDVTTLKGNKTSIDLLWTNSSMSSFSSRTISLSLSSYSAVIIDNFGYDYDVLNVAIQTNIIPIGDKARMVMFHQLADAGANGNISTRLVSVTTSGVTFGNNVYKVFPDGSSLTTDNRFNIPRRIYGIKVK